MGGGDELVQSLSRCGVPRVGLQEGDGERELKDESLVDGDGRVAPEAPTQSGSLPARAGGRVMPHHMACSSARSAAQLTAAVVSSEL